MTSNLWIVVSGYLLVATLWGCTNPFIKHAQQKSAEIDKLNNNKTATTFENLSRLITKPSLFLPYAINQCGSLVYYYMLSNQPVNQANPICNSLTFVFTAITGYWFFNETYQYPSLLFMGVLLVIAGIYVCITS